MCSWKGVPAGGGWLGLRQRDLEVKVFSLLCVNPELRVPLFPVSALSVQDQTGLSISLAMQLCNPYSPALDSHFSPATIANTGIPSGLSGFPLRFCIDHRQLPSVCPSPFLPIHLGAHQKCLGDLTVFPVPFVATETVSQTFDLPSFALLQCHQRYFECLRCHCMPCVDQCPIACSLNIEQHSPQSNFEGLFS